MKKLILALALLFTPSLAAAQCNGVFAANTVCGSNAGGVPGQLSTIDINAVNITPTPASNAQGLTILQTYSGSTLFPFIGPVNFARTGNGIAVISDNASPANNGFIDDFAITHQFGGSATLGGRQPLFVWLQQTAPTSASNTNRNYSAGVTIGDSQSGDGGTNTGAGALGAVFGANPQCRLGAAATNMLACAGVEIDVLGTGTSSSKYVWGNAFVSQHVAQGASLDTAMAIYSVGASGIYGPGGGFHNGLTFAEASANGLPPVDSGATLIGTHLETLMTFSAATGVDFTKFVFSGNAFQSNAYSVTQAGVVTGSAYKAGATAGVTCSGTPTSSFASVNGIVTHC